VKPYFEAGGVAIYHGRAEDVLPTLPAVNVVLTDPPYGVGLGTKKRAEKMSKHADGGYLGFDDSPEYVTSVVVPIIETCRSIAERVVLTPGLRCLFHYPEPDALWSIYYPNGAGVGRWRSFTCWQPILCYGSTPRIRGCFPDTFVATEQAEANGHPCPKPIGVWRRLMARTTLPGDLILDPFLGSGTTARAAIDLGRRCIGIDSDERSCEIAARRLEQQTMFAPEPVSAPAGEQAAMFADQVVAS
jgi:site-specific DNA-methyltransferase (adenine-specific)